MGKCILVFAPHPDDEILGVGGTMIKKHKEGYKIVVCIATQGKDIEVRKKEELKAQKVSGIDVIEYLGFEDLSLDKVSHSILNDSILKMIDKYKPVEVYTPHIADLHTDHRALTEGVLVATRPKYDSTPSYVYTYETLSETGWNYLSAINQFDANVYVDIENEIEDKIETFKQHETQVLEYPSCRSLEAIKSLAVYRGTQAEMKYAEAFKLVRGYLK